MKEQKYIMLVDYKSFKKGELVERVKKHCDDHNSKAYSNGENYHYLYEYQVAPVIDGLVGVTTEHKLSSYEKEVNVGNVFEVGSKWVAKCDITCSDDGDLNKEISKGTIIRVVDNLKRISLIEFNGSRYLTLGEAKLLLEPYVEPLREMTAEQIAKEFNVKVVE